MRTPYRCPKCGGPLLNQAMITHWAMKCVKHLTHYIVIYTPSTSDQIDMITIAVIMGTSMMDRVYASWDFPGQVLTISNGYLESNQVIPFFEPNLSEYDKLIQKMRTYLTFS